MDRVRWAWELEWKWACVINGGRCLLDSGVHVDGNGSVEGKVCEKYGGAGGGGGGVEEEVEEEE